MTTISATSIRGLLYFFVSISIFILDMQFKTNERIYYQFEDRFIHKEFKSERC
jgi:hypothetical protein